MSKKLLVQVFGAVLVLVGILGFVPGITTDNLLLGLFQVDTMHNLVHILTGAVGLALVTTQGQNGAILFGKIFAVVYALITVLGFVTGYATGIPGVVPVNAADHVLHVALTLVFAYIGFATVQASEA